MKRTVLFLFLMSCFSGLIFSSVKMNGSRSDFPKADEASKNQDQKKSIQQIWESFWNKNKSNEMAITEVPGLNSVNSTPWVSLGPNSRPKGNSSTIGVGCIRSLWVDPKDFDHILAGASSGGLWETTDGGNYWKCLTDTVATGGVTDIAVDPRSADVIYISTKTSLNGLLKLSGVYSMGLFKTTNGGKSWGEMPVDYQRNEYFEQVKIDPEDRSVIYALSNKAVYKSTDFGNDWKKTKLNVSDNVDLIDLRFKPNRSKTIYISGKNGLYVSQNRGKSWTSIKENLTGAFVNCRFTIATNPVNSDELYVLYNDLDNFEWDGTPNRIEKTTNEGSTWTLVSSEKLTSVRYTSEIALSPKGDIYAGGIYLKKSTDGGKKFRMLASNLIHPDMHDIVFPDSSNNKLIYVANDGGVYKDSTGGENWERINGNLATCEFYNVAISEGKREVMVGGTQDCGSYYRDSLGFWNFILGGDGGTSLVDQRNPQVFYISSNNSFSRTENNKNQLLTNLAELNSPVKMDPTNSDILYCHRWVNGDTPPVHILKSSDKGNTWATLEQEWNNLTDIAVSFSNPNYIYYSMWDSWSSSRIRRTTDGGATWSNVNHSGINSICGAAPVKAIFVNPFDPLKLWIAFGGFEDNRKVYFSNDGGDSWSNISGTTLPNVPVQCLQYDYINQTLYAGTDIGLYYKNDDDTEWQFAKGFPRAVVSTIQLNKLNGDLVVSTYGRGIWRTNLGDGYNTGKENREK